MDHLGVNLGDLTVVLPSGAGESVQHQLDQVVHVAPLARATAYPLLVALQSVPKIGLAPLMVVWLGYGFSAKIAMAFLFAFFPILIGVLGGLAGVPAQSASNAAGPLADWKQMSSGIGPPPTSTVIVTTVRASTVPTTSNARTSDSGAPHPLRLSPSLKTR